MKISFLFLSIHNTDSFFFKHRKLSKGNFFYKESTPKTKGKKRRFSRSVKKIKLDNPDQNLLSLNLSHDLLEKIDLCGKASLYTYNEYEVADPDLLLFAKSDFDSHLQWKSFFDVRDKEVIVAFRGTKTIYDLYLDSILYLYGGRDYPKILLNEKLLGTIIKDIDEAIDKVCETNHYPIVITGHSLGGLYAQIASMKYGMCGITFAAPPVMNGLIDAYNFSDRDEQESEFLNLLVEGDFVPYLSSDFGDYHGHILNLDLPREGILNSHSIRYILKGLKKGVSIIVSTKKSSTPPVRVILSKFINSICELTKKIVTQSKGQILLITRIKEVSKYDVEKESEVLNRS